MVTGQFSDQVASVQRQEVSGHKGHGMGDRPVTLYNKQCYITLLTLTV